MLFCMRAQYSQDALQALIQNPTDRSQAINTALQAVGGKLQDCWGTGGGIDQGIQIVYDVPDGVGQQAFVNAITASGSVNTINVQRLYTPEETVQALKKAQDVQKAYEPPAVRRS